LDFNKIEFFIAAGDKHQGDDSAVHGTFDAIPEADIGSAQCDFVCVWRPRGTSFNL
jgi:hypothetical protein